MGSTSGSRTIFTTVCATRSAMVGIPKGRIPPLAFGISTRRTGGAKYDPDDIRFQTLKRFLFRSFSKAAMETPSTPAAPWFSFTCSQASQTRRLEMSYGFASDIGSSRRRLADFFGWKIGSLRSARVTGPRRYYEPVRPCATHPVLCLWRGRHLRALPWHRSTGSHVPHKSLSSGSRRLDTGCRPASRQASAGLGPKGRSRLWFRQHLEWLSIRHRRFTHVRLPDTHLTASHPPFPSTLTTPAVILERLVAVWTLILQSEPEGPALISCAARLLRSDSTFANLLLAPSWRTDLGHLEGDIAAVADDLRADLDQLLLQAGQGPVLDWLGYRQRAQEVAEVIGQGVKLETHRISSERAAGQPRPVDRVLAFLDPLLGRAALIVEGHDPLGRARQVGHDEADAGVEFARMPLDLGHDAARHLPTLRPVAEAGVVAPDLDRRTADGTLEQVADAFLQHTVGRQPDRVVEALGFQELVNLGVCKSGIGAKIEARDLAPIARHDRFEHVLTAVRAMYVTGTQGAAFQIAELVEEEQRMIAGAGVMAVPDAHLLLAVRRADARIHVEHDASGRATAMHSVDPLPGKIEERRKVPFRR